MRLWRCWSCWAAFLLGLAPAHQQHMADGAIVGGGADRTAFVVRHHLQVNLVGVLAHGVIMEGGSPRVKC